MQTRRAALILLAAAPLTACGRRRADLAPAPAPAGASPEMMQLVARHADDLGIPESLLHRVIRRESGYNPAARNGPYWGLMQVHPQTAATMGFRGPPEALLDPDTNLRYAGRYLRGAWIVADGDEDEAVRWYASGYYFEARDRGLLEETGLRG